MRTRSARKSIALLGLLACLASVTAACGSSNSSSKGGGGGSSALSPSSWLYLGSVTDADYTAAQYEAMKAMASQFGLKTSYADSVSVADVERLATEDIASGSKTVILTTSSWFTNVSDLASKNPGTDFVGYIGSPAPPAGQAKNLWLMGLNFYDAEYVLGVLAGHQSKSHKIAYLAGLKIPGLIAGANAYRAGACSVDPSIQVSFVVVGSFDDTTMALNASTAIIQRGVDVLQVHLNGGIPGAVQAISSSGHSVYWTGLNTDKYALDKNHYLGSATFDYAGAYRKVFTALKAGIRSGFYNLAKGFRLTRLYHVAPATQAEVAGIMHKVISGTINVPIDSTAFKASCG